MRAVLVAESFDRMTLTFSKLIGETDAGGGGGVCGGAGGVAAAAATTGGCTGVCWCGAAGTGAIGAAGGRRSSPRT